MSGNQVSSDVFTSSSAISALSSSLGPFQRLWQIACSVSGAVATTVGWCGALCTCPRRHPCERSGNASGEMQLPPTSSTVVAPGPAAGFPHSLMADVFSGVTSSCASNVAGAPDGVRLSYRQLLRMCSDGMQFCIGIVGSVASMLTMACDRELRMVKPRHVHIHVLHCVFHNA